MVHKQEVSLLEVLPLLGQRGDCLLVLALFMDWDSAVQILLLPPCKVGDLGIYKLLMVRLEMPASYLLLVFGLFLIVFALVWYPKKVVWYARF